MHGRRREEYKARLADRETAASMEKKALSWHALNKQLLGGSLAPAQSLALTENLLKVNPDPLVLWNFRRKLLLETCIEMDISKELTLTQACLERNPKAYGAWFHRKWILSNYNSENDKLLQKELELCALFLLKDERNFHCWNFRKFIVGLLLLGGGKQQDGSWNTSSDETTMGAQVVVISDSEEKPLLQSLQDSSTTQQQQQQEEVIQAEWDFCTQKIQQNFSNYSAFHYRSKLLCLLQNNTDTLLRDELELVHNAIFTEPDDQTAWWYFRFLLVEAFAPVSIEILKDEVELLNELNETEDGQSKWTWLGLHVVYGELLKQGENVEQELEECLERLVYLDPDRAARYASLTKQTK